MNLSKFKNKALTLFLALTVIALGMMFSKNSKATTDQFSGSCAGALNFARKGKVWSDGKSVNALIVVNFETNTFEMSSTQFESSMPKGYATQTVVTTTFKLSVGPVQGSYQLTDVALPAKIPVMYLLPVNDGRSFLLQVKDDDVVGVCQKV